MKKGLPLKPNLVNLKSNTMKNTLQIYVELHHKPNIVLETMLGL